MTLSGAKYLGIVVTVVAVAAISGCVQSAQRNEETPTPAPTPTSLPEPTATPEPTPSPTPDPTPTTTPEPTQTATATPAPSGTATVVPVSNTQIYSLNLEIEGISDESVVRGDSIVLRGQTTADAIVSINGVIVPVDEMGNFEVPLLLEPGPNQITVVASDLDGNQVSASFLVVSLPEEQA